MAGRPGTRPAPHTIGAAPAKGTKVRNWGVLGNLRLKHQGTVGRGAAAAPLVAASKQQKAAADSPASNHSSPLAARSPAPKRSTSPPARVSVYQSPSRVIHSVMIPHAIKAAPGNVPRTRLTPLRRPPPVVATADSDSDSDKPSDNNNGSSSRSKDR